MKQYVWICLLLFVCAMDIDAQSLKSKTLADITVVTSTESAGVFTVSASWVSATSYPTSYLSAGDEVIHRYSDGGALNVTVPFDVTAVISTTSTTVTFTCENNSGNAAPKFKVGTKYQVIRPTPNYGLTIIDPRWTGVTTMDALQLLFKNMQTIDSQITGGGGGGCTPVCALTPIGGDLYGFHSNAQIVAGAVGSAEISADAIDSTKVLAGSLSLTDLSPQVQGLLGNWSTKSLTATASHTQTGAGYNLTVQGYSNLTFGATSQFVQSAPTFRVSTNSFEIGRFSDGLGASLSLRRYYSLFSTFVNFKFKQSDAQNSDVTIVLPPNAPPSEGVVMRINTDGQAYWSVADSTGVTDTNLGSTDLILAGDRGLDGDGHSLTLFGISDYAALSANSTLFATNNVDIVAGNRMFLDATNDFIVRSPNILHEGDNFRLLGTYSGSRPKLIFDGNGYKTTLTQSPSQAADYTIVLPPDAGTLGQVLSISSVASGVVNTEFVTALTSADLGYTASPTNGTVTNTAGADATLPVADGTNAGLMTPANFTKLAGVAAGATANDTDANLKARANHTGTQTAATISDFTTAARTAAVADAITDAVTTIAPSQNAVFDALATKQATLTLTTTGTSGAATLVGSTLNIPAYSGGGGGGFTVQVDTYKVAGTYTYNIPVGAKTLTFDMVGAGGGGGSGRVSAAGIVAAGGGGGAGGSRNIVTYSVTELGNPTTLLVVVGAGGTGGAAISSSDANGAAGGTGGNTYISAFGSAIMQMSTSGGGNGGTTAGSAPYGTVNSFCMYSGSIGGSGSSSSGAGANAPSNGGISSSGGGGGGGVSAPNAKLNGGGGGAWNFANINSASATTVEGANGANGVKRQGLRNGGGAAGGCGSAVGNGGNGGTGVQGGGGGGGGGCRNGFASGAGGNGGDGFVAITAQ